MPVCSQCDNRHFKTKEGLLQHIRNSSAWHPFCTTCDRRFVSQTGYDAHMAAKHPPTFDCTLCGRTYHAPFALEDHYRGSNAHPNCTKCGRGFRDPAARDEHRSMVHPKTTCTPCGGKLIYDEELQNHYWDSPNHPKCHSCNTGCKDEQDYLQHMSAVHPEQHCAVCNTTFETSQLLQAHLWTCSVHPKCDRCKMGFANNEAKDFHAETIHTPKLAAALNIVPDHIQHISQQTSETMTSRFTPSSLDPSAYGTDSTGFTTPSPLNGLQSLMLGKWRMDSPALSQEFGSSSPIIDVKPPCSPASLPHPGVKIKELWNLTQNVQVSPSRITYTVSPPRTVDSNSSIRTSDAASVSGRTVYSSYAGAVAGVRASSQFSYSPARHALSTSTESINWEDLMGVASFERLLPTGDASSPTTTVYDSPDPSSLILVQQMATHAHFQVVPQSLVHSRSFETTSSPASSALGSSPGAYEANTRPTTASSTPNHKTMHGLIYTSTPSSECSNPSPIQPPDLSSPMCLKSLPSMSPLATTPTDIVGYNIPEARHPLLESLLEIQPPITTVSELLAAPAPPYADPELFAPKLVSLRVPPPTASPESSVQRCITSPHETEPEPVIAIDALRASPTPTSPPHELPTAELAAAFDVPITTDKDGGTTGPDSLSTLSEAAGMTVVSPRTVTTVASAHGAVTVSLSETEVGSEGALPPKESLNPLHCRVCLTDRCDDITVSMCGHIFCRKCITDTVIRTSRCPVCKTPTLLYCLFKLDIAAQGWV